MGTRMTSGIQVGALALVASALSACAAPGTGEHSVTPPAPLIGPEFDIGKLKLESGSKAPVIRESPDAGASPTGFLVAWIEHRFDSVAHDLVATRVARDGTVLDPEGILIATDAQAGFRTPSVAFDGVGWVVVWTGGRNRTPDTHAARVTLDGTVLDVGGVNVSRSGNATGGEVACDGTTCLVAWNDWRRGRSDVFAARLGPGGTLLEAGGRLLSGASHWVHAGFPIVAAGSSGFLVATTDWRDASYDDDAFAQRVSSAGVVLDPQGIRLGDGAWHQHPVAAASDGVQWIVLYYDVATKELRRTRVDHSGDVLDNQVVADSRTSGASIVHDGSSFLVVLRDLFGYPERAPTLRGARITAGGGVVDVPPFLVSDSSNGGQSRPALAVTHDETILVAYEANRGDGSTIKARIIAPRSSAAPRLSSRR